MKIVDSQNVLTAELPNETKKFSIKPSAKAFSILVDSLYPNSVRACIRELSTNAVDAHIMAGHNNPIVVNLPTTECMKFSVEDSGIGMSESDIINIFTTVFESNKTGSNDTIGGFGLGSKTPFAYGNKSFTVTSVKDGVKVVYYFFIDEDELPSYTLISKEYTTENNGTKVEFDVMPGDAWRFQTEAKSVYMWFPVRPILNVNIAFDQFKINSYTDSVSTYNGTDSIVVMGGVAYKFNTGLTKFLNVSKFKYILHANVGDFDITADRENIQMTNKSKLAFETFYENFKDSSRDKIQQKIDQEPNLYRALLVNEEYNLFGIADFTYNGKKLSEFKQINQAVDIKIYDHYGHQMHCVELTKGKLYHGKKFLSYAKKTGSDNRFIICDENVYNELERTYGELPFKKNSIESFKSHSNSSYTYTPVTKCMSVDVLAREFSLGGSINTPDSGFYILREGKKLVGYYHNLPKCDAELFKGKIFAFTKREIAKLDPKKWISVSDELARMKAKIELEKKDIVKIKINNNNFSTLAQTKKQFFGLFDGYFNFDYSKIELTDRQIMIEQVNYISCDYHNDPGYLDILKIESELYKKYPLLKRCHDRAEAAEYVKLVDFYLSFEKGM